MSGFIYILASHIKFYLIYLNDLVAKLNQNKLQKIENRNKKKGAEAYLALTW